VSKDPIGLRGGINVHEYGPNPITWIDPKGLQTRNGLSEDENLMMCKNAGIQSYCKGTPIHGQWCGPDWTGGQREEYSSQRDVAGYYKGPKDELDRACMVHDKTYESCRLRFPCDDEAKKSCMKDADHTLQNSANKLCS
jgi:uncharacterized protein RhaS with RHS repeats